MKPVQKCQGFVGCTFHVQVCFKINHLNTFALFVCVFVCLFGWLVDWPAGWLAGWLVGCLFVCLFVSLFVCYDSVHPSHKFVGVFSYLSGLNQHKAEDNAFCSRTQHSAFDECLARDPWLKHIYFKSVHTIQYNFQSYKH